MPKQKPPSFVPSNDLKVVEAQVLISTRGRSVVNGTMSSSGKMMTFKSELNESDKEKLIEALTDIISRSTFR